MRWAIYGVVGLLFFGGAAAGSWYVKTEFIDAKEEEGAADDPLGIALTSAEGAQDETEPVGVSDEMRVPLRPEPVTLEEILVFNQKLDEREQTLQNRENDMENEEKRLKIILGDIQSEAATMESIQQSIADNLQVLENKLLQVQETQNATEDARNQVDAEKKKLDEFKMELGMNERENLKQIAQVVAGMDAGEAAGLLQEYANSGKLDLAAEILGRLETRDAAGVLGELGDDKALQMQLTEKMRTRAKEAPPKKGR